MSEKAEVLRALREIERLSGGRGGVPGFFTATALVCKGDGDLFASCFYAFALADLSRHPDHGVQLRAAIEALEKDAPVDRSEPSSSKWKRETEERWTYRISDFFLVVWFSPKKNTWAWEVWDSGIPDEPAVRGTEATLEAARASAEAGVKTASEPF